jgi:hypothetical protein
MRPTLRLACVLAAVMLAMPAVARAGPDQDAQNPQPARPRKPLSIGLRAYGIVDFNTLAAKESFEAVLGTPKLKAYGGGVEVDIWKNIFVRVAGTRARETGSRVFVSGGDVFQLGIPLTVTMTPIEAGGGWRFRSKSGRLTPYAGISYLSMGYVEESEFAEAGENTSERFTGQAVFGGFELGILKWLTAAAEAQYRRVPDALGAGGASKEFNETDLGGFAARVTIGIRTKR